LCSIDIALMTVAEKSDLISPSFLQHPEYES